jgi:hypothetical protein
MIKNSITTTTIIIITIICNIFKITDRNKLLLIYDSVVHLYKNPAHIPTNKNALYHWVIHVHYLNMELKTEDL